MDGIAVVDIADKYEYICFLCLFGLLLMRFGSLFFLFVMASAWEEAFVFVRVTFSFEFCILPERYSTIIHFRSLGPFYRLFYLDGFVGVESLFWLVECFGGFLWEVAKPWKHPWICSGGLQG